MAEATLRRYQDDADRGGFPRYAFEWIDRITFLGGAMVIHKRDPEVKKAAQAQVLAAAEQSRQPRHLHAAAGVMWKNQGDLRGAARLATAASAAAPDNFDYVFRLAQILLELGELEQADDAFARSIALSPNHIRAFEMRGLGRLRAKDHEAALRCFQAAVKLGKRFPQLHRYLAVAYEHLGRGAEAIEAMRGAVQAARSGAHSGEYAAELERLEAKYAGQ